MKYLFSDGWAKVNIRCTRHSAEQMPFRTEILKQLSVGASIEKFWDENQPSYFSIFTDSAMC